MDKNKTNKFENSEEFDPLVFLTEIWNKKLIILIATFTTLFIGFVHLKNSTYMYEVSIQVTPASSSAKTSIKGSELSGLASQIMSFSNTKSEPENFGFYKSLYKSRFIAEKVSSDIEILKKIFSSEWDQNQKEWLIPENKFSSQAKNFIKKLLGIPINNHQVPNTERVYDFLYKNIIISSTKNDIITNIKIITNQTENAKYILEKLHIIVDEAIKVRSLNKTNAYINFLNNELAQNQNKDQRLSIINTLSSQYKIKMIADSNLPFAAELFSKPYTSSTYVRPNPRLVISAFIGLGIFIGIFIILVMFVIKLRKKTAL